MYESVLPPDALYRFVYLTYYHDFGKRFISFAHCLEISKAAEKERKISNLSSREMWEFNREISMTF